MHGRGNFVPPQFGQGLQRPMPPYQQAPTGHPPPFQFQPGQPFPMQQGGPPHGGPPRGPGYPHVPPAPLNMPPHGPSNPSQSFFQRPMVHGGPPPRLPFPGGQPNFPPGSQNTHHGTPPPQLPSFGPPRALPPPPLQHPNAQQGVHNMSLPPPPVPQAPPGFFSRPNFTPFPQQLSVGSQMKLPPQPPPPPPLSVPMVPNPPSSSLAGGSPITDGDVPSQSQIFVSESTASVKIGSSGESVPMELPPPPPKPADEAVLRNIEVLCQFIAKNGSQFEEMARKKESENPKFSFLVGGEPGIAASCAREYFLWMKKKWGILNDLNDGQEQQKLSQMHADGNASAVLNSSVTMATVHSPADSDVDMEDDITQTDKEPEVYTSVDDLKSEAVSTEQVPIMQKQETVLLDTRDRSAVLNSNPPPNSVLEALDDITKTDKESELYISGEDLKSELVSTGEVSDIQNHETTALTSNPPIKSEEEAAIKPVKSSGQLDKIDNPFGLIRNYASDDNSDDELPHEHGKAETVSPPPISVTAGADSFLMKEDTLAGQSETQGTLTIGCSSVKHESGDRYDTEDLSNPNTVFQGRYATKSSAIETAASKDIDRKDRKSTSTTVKVDEFGRLVKEGASDSESDGAQRLRRRGKRDRSRSRSRSPSDRRRRRSPFRRKSRRSRSRSWSPKKRRSRSKSPNRSIGDFGGENMSRGKAQTQECFDFLKGRCYRGASCKYLHRDVGKSESSRRYKDKQYQADVASARNSQFGDRVTSSVPLEYDDTKVEKMPYDPDKFDGDYLTTKTNDEKCKAESIIDMVPNVFREDVHNSTVVYKNSEGHRENTVHVQGASGEHMSHLPIGGEHQTLGMPSTGETIHRCSVKAPQEDNCDLPTVVASGNAVSSLVETSLISPSEISTESYQGLASNEPTGPSASILNLPSQISHSPMPPLASQTVNAPQQSSGLVEYSSITPPVSFPHHTVPPYHAPLPIQQSHYPVPTTSGTALLFQRGSIPLRTDFLNQMSLRDQSGNLAGNSQVGEFQHQAYHLHPSNVSARPFGPSLVRDDRLSQFSSHGHGSAGTYTPGVPTQPGLFPGESNVTQSFPGSNTLAGDASKQALHSHQFLHQRPPAFGPSLTAGDSGPSHPGGSQSVSGQTSDPLGREQPSHLVDVGQSRISAHYNPYASTFDQPLSSRFSSAFAQEKVSTASVKYDPSFSLNHGTIEGLAASGYGARQISSSLNSSRPGGRMPRLSGDQYDPLFDSIEPSSKRALNQDHAADNSDILKGGDSHQKVLDVAENSKQKEVGAVVATTSLDNDEYGETGDAEVGAVENESLSDSDDDAIVAEGEIDQINPGGNNKKSKDSRSMKLFKVAVANFVKEVLKPQWRQGNMSKEVFKTIVKKTVDKVSGAMKNHRVPKSQAKIDHYIDSSRRKLTQLVEGYVSKYKS